ncbi:beta-phosphoglucomutase [Secundilactobacillus folii]|uniref:Beta-phosphoglucomutase n=1 Tax=Secundilactobacillus folii TaxID=2678357 RepID=A0A7X2XWP9_9LACO|nr:beta-phosphoglucomutase [Secundilactobacillus folii]MTV83074.1 beta-phosphoglucomutase [Secundilactobacillus folii]
MVRFEQYSGVLFDLHGVIADSSQYHLQAWHQLADELEITWTPKLAATLLGMNRQESVATILTAGRKLDQYSDAQQAELGERKNKMYLDIISHMSPADVLPGIIRFLDELQANHYGIVLASASVNAPLEIHKMQLEKYFPLIVDPSTLTRNKPDPEIYVRAASMLNLPPKACFGIEDSKPGLAAVNGSGALSVGVGSRAEIATAQVRFSSTASLTLAGIQQQLVAKQEQAD